jgi:Poly(ADP-ribose) polymerase catalytic domain
MEPWSNVILVKPSSSEAIRAFEDLKRSAGGSLFAFHASPFFNWHSILRSNIKIASGTVLQTHGRAFGDGIYMGSDLDVVVSYSLMGDAWRNSTFGAECIGLYEVVRDEHVTSDQSRCGTNANVLFVTTEANVMLRCSCVFSRPTLKGSRGNVKASHMAALVALTHTPHATT